MTDSHTSNSALVQQCLAHLHQEYVALDQLNVSLLAVREALSRHDTQQLPALLESQQEQMQHVAAVRQRRLALRREIAAELDTPEDDVSITQWASQLGPDDRDRVLVLKNQLAEIADESARLAQSNMAVVSYGMQLLGEVMCCLTGESRGQRYAASGQHCPAPPTSLFQNRY